MPPVGREKRGGKDGPESSECVCALHTWEENEDSLLLGPQQQHFCEEEEEEEEEEEGPIATEVEILFQGPPSSSFGHSRL